MALIMMCGRPVTGKTRRAEEIAEYFREHTGGEKRVLVIGEASLGLPREMYDDPKDEKILRATIKSAVEREVNSETIVICDSLNYIKGFRYELFCIAKALKIRSCVVYVNTDDDTASQWNDQGSPHILSTPSASSDAGEGEGGEGGEGGEDDHGDGPTYPEDLFDDLWSRFEVPMGNKRWDKPLFEVGPEDELPLEQMADYLLRSKAVKVNMSTKAAPAMSTSLVSELDSATRAVVSAIITWAARGGLPGERILLDDPITGSTVRLVLQASVSAAALRRARKQFLKTVALVPPPREDIVTSFAQFLASSLI